MYTIKKEGLGLMINLGAKNVLLNANTTPEDLKLVAESTAGHLVSLNKKTTAIEEVAKTDS